MNDKDTYASGFLYFDGNLNELSALLSEKGVSNSAGRWAIRITDYPDFIIAYVGNITPNEPYEIEVDGYGLAGKTVDEWCSKMANIFTSSNIQFFLALYDANGDEIKEYNFRQK